jgi:hypothetical protein
MRGGKRTVGLAPLRKNLARLTAAQLSLYERAPAYTGCSKAKRLELVIHQREELSSSA